MQGRFAYVLLLWKPVLTAYEQPSFSLYLNGFTDQSLAPGGGGGTRYIPGWGGAARPLIP